MLFPVMTVSGAWLAATAAGAWTWAAWGISWMVWPPGDWRTVTVLFRFAPPLYLYSQ